MSVGHSHRSQRAEVHASTLPCGTPEITGLDDEQKLLKLVRWIRPLIDMTDLFFRKPNCCLLLILYRQEYLGLLVEEIIIGR